MPSPSSLNRANAASLALGLALSTRALAGEDCNTDSLTQFEVARQIPESILYVPASSILSDTNFTSAKQIEYIGLGGTNFAVIDNSVARTRAFQQISASEVGQFLKDISAHISNCKDTYVLQQYWKFIHELKIDQSAHGAMYQSIISALAPNVFGETLPQFLNQKYTQHEFLHQREPWQRQIVSAELTTVLSIHLIAAIKNPELKSALNALNHSGAFFDADFPRSVKDLNALVGFTQFLSSQEASDLQMVAYSLLSTKADASKIGASGFIEHCLAGGARATAVVDLWLRNSSSLSSEQSRAITKWLTSFSDVDLQLSEGKAIEQILGALVELTRENGIFRELEGQTLKEISMRFPNQLGLMQRAIAAEIPQLLRTIGDEQAVPFNVGAGLRALFNYSHLGGRDFTRALTPFLVNDRLSKDLVEVVGKLVMAGRGELSSFLPQFEKALDKISVDSENFRQICNVIINQDPYEAQRVFIKQEGRFGNDDKGRLGFLVKVASRSSGFVPEFRHWLKEHTSFEAAEAKTKLNDPEFLIRISALGMLARDTQTVDSDIQRYRRLLKIADKDAFSSELPKHKYLFTRMESGGSGFYSQVFKHWDACEADTRELIIKSILDSLSLRSQLESHPRAMSGDWNLDVLANKTQIENYRTLALRTLDQGSEGKMNSAGALAQAAHLLVAAGSEKELSEYLEKHPKLYGALLSTSEGTTFLWSLYTTKILDNFVENLSSLSAERYNKQESAVEFQYSALFHYAPEKLDAVKKMWPSELASVASLLKSTVLFQGDTLKQHPLLILGWSPQLLKEVLGNDIFNSMDYQSSALALDRLFEERPAKINEFVVELKKLALSLKTAAHAPRSQNADGLGSFDRYLENAQGKDLEGYADLLETALNLGITKPFRQSKEILKANIASHRALERKDSAYFAAKHLLIEFGAECDHNGVFAQSQGFAERFLNPKWNYISFGVSSTEDLLRVEKQLAEIPPASPGFQRVIQFSVHGGFDEHGNGAAQWIPVFGETSAADLNHNLAPSPIHADLVFSLVCHSGQSVSGTNDLSRAFQTRYRAERADAPDGPTAFGLPLFRHETYDLAGVRFDTGTISLTNFNFGSTSSVTSTPKLKTP